MLSAAKGAVPPTEGMKPSLTGVRLMFPTRGARMLGLHVRPLLPRGLDRSFGTFSRTQSGLLSAMISPQPHPGSPRVKCANRAIIIGTLSYALIFMNEANNNHELPR